MKIPLKYTLRSLGRRKVRTALTLAGIAFITIMTVLLSALVGSMWASIHRNGSPDNVIVLSKKAQNAVFSSIKEEEAGRLFDIEQIRFDEQYGAYLLSPEILTGMSFGVEGRKGLKRAVVRGVDPSNGLAFLVNDTVSITRLETEVGGRRISFRSGLGGPATLRIEGGDQPVEITAPDLESFIRANRDAYVTYVASSAPSRKNEVLVGRLAFVKMNLDPQDLDVGKKLAFGGLEFTISGVFEAPGTSHEAEIWAHVEDLKVYLNRRTYSQIVIKADRPENVAAVVENISRREDVKLNAQPEAEFYAAYTGNFKVFRILIIVVGIILCLGGVFAGMNTMYAAVMGRIREIGMLKVLGFPRRSIFLSIISEAVIISVAGGLLGCLGAWGLSAFLSRSGGIGIPMELSMNAFLIRVQPFDAAVGVCASFAIGAAGALMPALKGIRMRTMDAIRWA